MTTAQKVEALNKKCENSLGFQCYTSGWEATSFIDGTPFNVEPNGVFMKGKTFKEIVDNAYKFVFEK